MKRRQILFAIFKNNTPNLQHFRFMLVVFHFATYKFYLSGVEVKVTANDVNFY